MNPPPEMAVAEEVAVAIGASVVKLVGTVGESKLVDSEVVESPVAVVRDPVRLVVRFIDNDFVVLKSATVVVFVKF